MSPWTYIGIGLAFAVIGGTLYVTASGIFALMAAGVILGGIGALFASIGVIAEGVRVGQQD